MRCISWGAGSSCCRRKHRGCSSTQCPISPPVFGPTGICCPWRGTAWQPPPSPTGLSSHSGALLSASSHGKAHLKCCLTHRLSNIADSGKLAVSERQLLWGLGAKEWGTAVESQSSWVRRVLLQTGCPKLSFRFKKRSEAQGDFGDPLSLLPTLTFISTPPSRLPLRNVRFWSPS